MEYWHRLAAAPALLKEGRYLRMRNQMTREQKATMERSRETRCPGGAPEVALLKRSLYRIWCVVM
jgi:hypothetical protein